MADVGASWLKTQIGNDRLKQEGKIQEVNGEAFYEGRRIIHRDSPINNGIYVGAGRREAIFVDYDRSPSLQRFYSEAKARATVDGAVKNDKVLNAVYDVVKGGMAYSEGDVDLLVQSTCGGGDKPMTLEIFAASNAGVCRHMALACGMLLEKFKEDGHVRGSPSVDRNSTWKGGHAWCRYRNFAGDVFILDPAQGYIGALKNAPDSHRWPYERPDDF